MNLLPFAPAIPKEGDPIVRCLAKHLLCVLCALTVAMPSQAAKRNRQTEDARTEKSEGQGPALAKVQVSELVIREALPETFFGFNVNYYAFQETHMRGGAVHEDVIGYLRALPGAVYRFPGGLMANSFDWEGSVGAIDKRRSQTTFFGESIDRATFGPEEYLHFVSEVKGRSWFVLNLVGWGGVKRQELDTQQVAQSNQRLAVFRKRADTSPIARYYQLGNELDRSEFEWAPEKYIERARASIEAIKKVDPEARFVPFLRDFDWRYKSREGISRADDFARTVMQALPMADDYSLNTYYDSARDTRRTDVAFRADRVQKVVDTVNAVTGRKPGLWITEHALQLPEDRKSGSIPQTSGIDGAISVADYIMALASIPEVRGMMLQALGGLKWSIFVPAGSRMEPTPVYWMLRLLNENKAGRLLGVTTASSNVSNYAGGYDTRALAFRSGDGKTLTVWAVNRSETDLPLQVAYGPFAGKSVSTSVSYVKASTLARRGASLESTRNLNPNTTPARFDLDGGWATRLPARSINVVRISLSE